MKFARILLFFAILSSSGFVSAGLAYILDLTDGYTALIIAGSSLLFTAVCIVLGTYAQNKANERILREEFDDVYLDLPDEEHLGI